MRLLIILVALVHLLGLLGPSPTAQAFGSKPKSQDAFDREVDAYFDDYFRRNPSAATSAGFHEHDDELEDPSVAARQDEATATRKFLDSFLAIDPAELTPGGAIDRELVLGDARTRLLTLEDIRGWEKNPDHYGSEVSESVFPLMARRFAPAADRLRSVIARERKIPAYLRAGRENLRNPPRLWTEIALEQLPGIADFFRKDVVEAFKEVSDPKLRSEFAEANAAAIAAVQEYEAFVRKTVLPASKGDYRLGEALFRKKLLYDERVALPLDRLLEVGMANLRDNQRAFAETSRKIDPAKKPEQLLAELVRDHPSAGRLLDSTRELLGGIRTFIEEHAIVTIPEAPLPIVEETPPFERALTFASMDTPGPYEMRAKEAYFNVTLPEPGWSAKETEEHLQGYNRGTLAVTAIHEAYPGHYVQFLWLQGNGSKARKLLGANTYIEGWAHYCEQMLLDEGYGGGDPRLRLGQLQDALMRNARFIVSVRLHTGAMTFDEAVDFFVREGYQSRTNAIREVKRGTTDPTYLYYTLGKLEILKLREDYRKAKGASYSLRAFHDDLLSLGMPPLSLARRAMLGAEGDAL
jgi:uncharacterized protein (DUF885 family)